MLAGDAGSVNRFSAYDTATVSRNPDGYPSAFKLYKLEEAAVTDPDPAPETVAAPTASPAGGEVEKGTLVSFSCATEGVTINYKTFGDYAEYTAPIAVNENTVFTVKASKDGADSEEAVFAYTVKTEQTEDPYAAIPLNYSIYELVTELQADDKVLIFNPTSGNVLSSTASGNDLAGEAQTPSDNYIAVDIADVGTIEWTVNTAEDALTFAQGGKMFSAYIDESVINLSTDAAYKTEWLLGECNPTNSTYYIYSKDLYDETYGPVCVKWDADKSAFSACVTSNLSEDAFDFAFYRQVREGVPEPVYDTIAEVLAGEIGDSFTVKGVVTLADGKNIYVQDATGGICCFPVVGSYKIGDEVCVTGTADIYQGELQLQVSSIELISEGNDVIPTEVTAEQINDRSVEGRLITLKGVVVSFEKVNDLVQTIMVRDEAGSVARVFIDSDITTDKEVENLALDADVTVTGIASYDNTFHVPKGPFPRIRIRDRADVVCSEIEEHIHDYTWTTDKEPTCTDPGQETGVCACGDTVIREIPATGHSFGEWTTITAATCTKDGREARGCAKCKLIETREIKATGHQFGEWTVVKEPTDYLSGKKVRVCSVCGETEMEKIPALKAPGTGDSSNILLWTVTFGVSACGSVLILIKSKKKHKSNHC